MASVNAEAVESSANIGQAALAAVRNPFRGAVVGNPWEPSIAQLDVADIHHDVFDKCLRLVEEVRDGSSSLGLIIHGGAGSGKTHLIGRLRRRLVDDEPKPLLEQLSHAFAYVRLNTSASRLARHVRSSIADDLLRAASGRTSQLERMVVTRLMEVLEGTGDVRRWWDYYREDHPDQLELAVRQLGDSERLSDRFQQILLALVLGKHRRDVSAWLKGETLTDAACERLDISPVDPDADPEVVAIDALTDFSRLAGHKIPLILCFDQIEALQTSLDDLQGLFAYSQLIDRLHSSDNNLVLISCLQTQRYQALCEAVGPYAQDRLRSGGAVALQLLNPPQAAALVRQRMSHSQLPTIRPRQADDLWPLTVQDLERIVDAKGVTPRELLNAAADTFELCQRASQLTDTKSTSAEFSAPTSPTAPPPAPNTTDWLDEEWDRRQSRAREQNRPEDSAAILAFAIPRLVELVEPDWSVAKEPQLPDIDYVLSAPRGEARVGVMICEDESRRLVHRLGRVRKELPHQSGLHKLVLLRDERNPYSAKAAKLNEHLQHLEKQDAVRLPVSPAALTALDAIRSLLSDAQSGDLACGATTIGPATVVEWLRANLSPVLQPLADALVTPAKVTEVGHSVDLSRLQERLNRTPLIPWSEVAAELGVSGRQEVALLNAVRDRADLFGLIHGEPQVLFAARIGSGLPQGTPIS
ncbi:MAG: hypothetical protein ACK5Q5_07915 [Planctomycetaceae bacterium]